MKKITRSTYRKDKYYKKVCNAVRELLKKDSVVTPADVFIQIGNLTKEDYENWRFGRIHYLEKVITCNLSKANRVLRTLNYHAQDRGLKPMQYVYKKWGKGCKRLLRFSKTENPTIELAYSRHYIAAPKERRHEEEKVY